jgi:hypothetical protein
MVRDFERQISFVIADALLKIRINSHFNAIEEVQNIKKPAKFAGFFEI